MHARAVLRREARQGKAVFRVRRSDGARAGALPALHRRQDIVYRHVQLEWQDLPRPIYDSMVPYADPACQGYRRRPDMLANSWRTLGELP